MKLLRTINGADGIRVTVWRDSEWDEYQVRIKGAPDATYFTPDKDDALATATRMVKDAERDARKEELE